MRKTISNLSLFKDIKDPFLQAVEQILGDRYSDRIRTIYETAIDYILKTLVDGFNGA